MKPLPAEEVRAALKHLLSAPALARAPKISRLLVYLVDAHLEEAPEALSEPVIANAVFDQRDGFNPRSNPIVRVNASRLRNVLRKHFAGDGADDPVHIHLAGIGYTLDIRRNIPPSADTAENPQTAATAERTALPPTVAPAPAPGQPMPRDNAPPPVASTATFGRLKQKLCAPVSLGAVIALLIAVSLLNIAYTHLVHATMQTTDARSSIAAVAPLRN